MHTALLLSLCALLSACGIGQAPRIDVVSATLTDQTDVAAGIDVELRLRNPNADDSLPLLDFEYTVSLDGQQVYEGRREAQATLSPDSVRVLSVPAVLVYDKTTWRPDSGTMPRVAITGQLKYRTPGTIADLLFDFGVRKPKVRFAGEQTLTPKG